MMSEKPSDILQQLNQVATALTPGIGGNPPWFSGSGPAWHALLTDTINEIKKNRLEITDLKVMRESYSRLYKQIYGGDYG
jgi:hypothetical protein